jgi:rhodanese-related sulfurtransferase
MSIPHKTHSPGFLAYVTEVRTRVKEIDIAMYQALPAGEHLLIDVREDHEWSEGHAQGALHLSKGIIERDIEVTVPDKATKMVLYCGGGYRSALVAEALGKMGYTGAISLNGGWRAWNEAGLPTEKE